MSKLKYYRTLNEKKKVFYTYKVINTKEKFNNYYDNIKSQAQNNHQILFFRGVNEAKYKLYNSAQRYWLNREMEKWGKQYREFINEIIVNARNWKNGKNMLTNFYKALGHPRAYDIAVMSFLQHYQAPTPLLDWTYDFHYSLFFGINGLRFIEQTRPIDNYFSIYIIVQDRHTGKNKKLKSLNEITSNDERPPSIESLFEHQLVSISDFDRKQNGLIVISDTPDTSKKRLYSNTNFNIINQKGLFIFNNSPTKPIENFLKADSTHNNHWVIDTINCWDIHKSLAEYIKNKIDPGNNLKEWLFPDPYKIAQDSLEDYLIA